MNLRLSTPISEEQISQLHLGDSVLLNGIIVTGRDMAHKWLIDKFVHSLNAPTQAEEEVYQSLKKLLYHGVIFHCGPIVSGRETREYKIISAGPTTSIRAEPYMSEIVRHLNLKGIIGKGGMGGQTLLACHEEQAVYFHAIGGTGALIAQSIQKVVAVYQMEFGVPEAMWVLEVKDLPLIVTMDTFGHSLHNDVYAASSDKLQKFIH